MNSSFDLKKYLQERKQIVELALEKKLPQKDTWPKTLNESIRYSLMAGGKRLRPILVLAAAETLGSDYADYLPAACAMEMIHTYSLIHDDLPAMDDDDLRRGRPTNHKVYGEAIAILAGDALLTQAFEELSKPFEHVDSSKQLEAIHRVALASGSQGMVGGQAYDLFCEKKKVSLNELEKIHRHKTGKLIQASLELGALLANANSEELESLSQYGQFIGLSFQIADDLLDIEGGEEIGKDIGSDIAREKATYPALLGLEASKKLAKEITEQALDSLKIFDEKAQALRSLAQYIIERKN